MKDILETNWFAQEDRFAWSGKGQRFSTDASIEELLDGKSTGAIRLGQILLIQMAVRLTKTPKLRQEPVAPPVQPVSPKKVKIPKINDLPPMPNEQRARDELFKTKIAQRSSEK
jgi:hypothetical protein